VAPAWRTVSGLSGEVIYVIQGTRLRCDNCKCAKSKEEFWKSVVFSSITGLRYGDTGLEVYTTFKRNTLLGCEEKSGWHSAALVVKVAPQPMLVEVLSQCMLPGMKTRFQKLLEAKNRFNFPSSRSVSSLHDEVLSQLNPVVRDDLGVVSLGHTLVSTQAVLTASLAAPSGVKLGKLVRVAKGVAKSLLLAREVNRERLIEIWKARGLTLTDGYQLGRCEDYALARVVTFSRLRRFYLANSARLATLQQSLLAGNAVGTVSLAWDHVFLSGNKAKTNGGKATFVAADMIGRPVAAVLSADKSVKNLPLWKPLFDLTCMKPERPIVAGQVHVEGQSSVTAGFSDAKADKKAFERLFTRAVMVRDLLHFFKDFYDCVPMKNPYRSTIILAVTSISYTYSEGDVSSLRTYLTSKGKSQKDINAILDCPTRIKKYRQIARPQLVSAEEFLPRFRELISRFTELGCFNAEKINKFQNQLDKKVKLSFEAPPGFVRFINISPDLENPRFRAVAGTNMIENQNGRMQQVSDSHIYILY
jgi:hypothetical protein